MVTPTSIASDISYGLGLLSSFGQKVDVVGIYSNGPNVNNSSGILSSTILNSILGTTAAPSFGQMFSNARPMKAFVRETSRVMEHPVETGVVLSDHHIINQVEIELPLIVSSQFYTATYGEIRQAFNGATPLSVKTRTGVYSDMIIADMPHEEDPEMYDAITILLHLKQVIYVVTGGGAQSNFQPSDPLNSNTLPSGLQQATALSSQLLSGVSGVISYANLGKFL